MIKNLYIKYLKTKFFSKVLLTYAAVTVFSLSVLALITSQSISNTLQSKELSYNNVIFHSVTDYFENKCTLIKKISQQAYLDNLSTPEVFNFLENDINISSPEYSELWRRFSGYFKSAFSRDPDITDIIIYKDINETFYQFTKSVDQTFAKKEFKFIELQDLMHSKGSLLNIVPSLVPPYLNDKRVYSMQLNIKVPYTNTNMGVLIIDFDPEGIRRMISQFAKEESSTLLILTKEGTVIYDSSSQFYDMKYPYFDLLSKSSSSVKINGKNCIVNVNTNSRTGVVVASILPKNVLYASVNTVTNTILTVALFCIFASILLIFSSSSIFSKRIKLITGAMKKLREGNLSTRIPLGNSGDEISDIVISFNRMCDNLEEYINKVYLYEIKQKRAELKALQSQINPHFLYNTLEAIRMKTVTEGNSEAGDMIYILAMLLRNTIKKETIIEIKDEFDYCTMYLELIKIRYGEKLHYKADIDNSIQKTGIIRHMLQPIIENYILHGFDISRDDNEIIIRGYRIDHDIYIEIEDNGMGISSKKLKKIKDKLNHPGIINDEDGHSIGLSNVSERIKIVFGQQYGITIESKEGSGTKVRIQIKSLSKKELLDYVQGTNS